MRVGYSRMSIRWLCDTVRFHMSSGCQCVVSEILLDSHWTAQQQRLQRFYLFEISFVFAFILINKKEEKKHLCLLETKDLSAKNHLLLVDLQAMPFVSCIYVELYKAFAPFWYNNFNNNTRFFKDRTIVFVE